MQLDDRVTPAGSLGAPGGPVADGGLHTVDLAPVTGYAAKRALDLTIIGIGAGPALIVGGIIAVLIRLESPGPVFFLQPRPGRGGRAFRMYKFRTMYVDAEQRFNDLPADLRLEFERYGKMKHDPRVTRVGRWLRKLSLDELPNLWNVVKGDMSLVGPRPYLLSQLWQMEGFREGIFQVAPGMTGQWQVSGRSSIPFEQRLALDAGYARSLSLWTDLKILARTPIVVLTGKGAF